MDETVARSEPWVPYVVPMVAFLALTAAEGLLPQVGGQPHLTWYPLAYAGKIGIVAALAWVCRSTWRDLSPRPGIGVLGLAVGLGLVIAGLWVGLDGHYPT